MVFQISQNEVERNGFRKRDIGKWACVICGCIHYLNAKTREEAEKDYRYFTEYKPF